LISTIRPFSTATFIRHPNEFKLQLVFSRVDLDESPLTSTDPEASLSSFVFAFAINRLLQLPG
jgi:hypothetical protein